MGYSVFPSRSDAQRVPSHKINYPFQAMRQFAINRDDLHNSLEARVAYLKSFIDFTNYDITALQQGQKYLIALIPAVANIVYQKLLRYSITAQTFLDRGVSAASEVSEVNGTRSACPYAAMASGDSSNVKMSSTLTEDSPMIRQRKLFLRSYLRRFLSDPGRMEFWQYLDRVGMLHAGLVTKKKPLYVEYVHLGILLGMIQDIFTQAIIAHPRMASERKAALVSALGKLIWIQNDFMSRWHVDDANDVFDRQEYMEGQRQKEARRFNRMDPSFTTPLEGGSNRSRAATGTETAATAGDKAPTSDQAEVAGKDRTGSESSRSETSSGAGSKPGSPISSTARCPVSGMAELGLAGGRCPAGHGRPEEPAAIPGP